MGTRAAIRAKRQTGYFVNGWVLDSPQKNLVWLTSDRTVTFVVLLCGKLIEPFDFMFNGRCRSGLIQLL
jgi:hypothetical protein